MTTTCSPIMTALPANVVRPVVCKRWFITCIPVSYRKYGYKFINFSITQYYFADFLVFFAAQIQPHDVISLIKSVANRKILLQKDSHAYMPVEINGTIEFIDVQLNTS